MTFGTVSNKLVIELYLMRKHSCRTFRTMPNRLRSKILEHLSFGTTSNRPTPKLQANASQRWGPFGTISNEQVPKPRNQFVY